METETREFHNIHNDNKKKLLRIHKESRVVWEKEFWELSKRHTCKVDCTPAWTLYSSSSLSATLFRAP